MIKRFFTWLKSLYYTPTTTAETQTSGDTMSEPLVDTSVDASAQAQPAAVEAQPAAPVDAADTSPQPVAQVETSTSALDKVKAEFEKFVSFVEHGIEVLGADAEAELVALKDKYL